MLGRKLQFDSQVAVYASACYWRRLATTTPPSVSYVVPAEGVSLADAEAALDKAVADFLADGIDDAQWQRIKIQIAPRRSMPTTISPRRRAAMARR